jgi:hypothetical protein
LPSRRAGSSFGFDGGSKFSLLSPGHGYRQFVKNFEITAAEIGKWLHKMSYRHLPAKITNEKPVYAFFTNGPLPKAKKSGKSLPAEGENFRLHDWISSGNHPPDPKRLGPPGVRAE